ncbi:tRNA-dependent cyclodipeptide synthase [Spirillospora sp. NPDC052269]
MSPTSSNPPATDPSGPPIGLDFRAVTATCRELFERGDHALFGVSAGNGYFTIPRLTALLSWACKHFASVDVVYADLFVDAMYIAAGETQEKAAARARKKLKDTTRRIERAIEEVGAPGSRIRARGISECALLPGYQAVQQRIRKLSAEDERIDRVCEDHVRYVLGGWTDVRRPQEEAEVMVQAGLDYLHAELPFLVDTPNALDVPTSVCCYHKLLPVVRGLWNSAVFNAQAQGHIVIRADGEG